MGFGMNIEKISVEKLLPAKYNPRKDLQPGDPEFEKLKRSITEFGYVEPIIWNKRTGVVIGGHQRLKVLQHLGYTEVDCVVLDIDEQKEKALNVALNKISGAWDVPLLTALLRDLDESGFDATLTGFDVSEMSELFDDQSEIVEDDPPEAAPEGTEPFSQLGDRWLLGRHVLYCGDSTEKKDVAALMGGKQADLVVTDPPYNVAYEGSNGLRIQNDDMPEEQFLAFLIAAFTRMHEVMKPGTPFYIWHAETVGGAFRRATNEALGKVRQMLVWNKNPNAEYAPRYYMEGTHEAIVDKDMWEAAQRILEERSRNHCRTRIAHSFTGMIECGCCGKNYLHKVNNSQCKWQTDIWACRTYLRDGKKDCGNSRIKDTVLKGKFISAYNEFIERRPQGDSMVALQEVLEDLRQQEQELAELMMQRLIPKAAYEEERKSVKMQITDISEKISERRAKRVTESEYVPITEFSEEKAKRFLSKVVVTMFTVTFVFYNGAIITRTYDNGQPGNKVGWNKKKEES